MALHTDGCEACQQRIAELLTAVYGKVSIDYDLSLPAKPEEYKVFPIYPALTEIHVALQRYCGYAGFVMADELPVAGFFVHNPGFILEYDRHWRFTLARAISLAYYPDNLELGFLKAKWVQMARSINYLDSERPYRNEQTAWYDTLLDFASAILDFKPTVRLQTYDAQWCTFDAGREQDLARFRRIVERM